MGAFLTSGSVTQVGYLTNEKNIDNYNLQVMFFVWKIILVILS